MIAPAHAPALADRLPPLRGRLTAAAALAPLTWFRVGGPAELLFRPADAEDLAVFLAGRPADMPFTVLGVASNLLIRDGGLPGVAIRLGRTFAKVEVRDDIVEAGAGALDGNVALTAAAAGLGGLEFLSGIPGTIGGGLRMNAGAYGRELKDVLVSATALDPQGRLVELTPEAMDLSYRHCGLGEDWVFLSARLRGTAEAGEIVEARMQAIRGKREASQPVRARTGGSTFANPPGEKAWALIDKAGCRGLRLGGAMVSELHANFLLNLGEATAAELEALGEEVRRRVLETSGISLRWEIKRIGIPADADPAQNVFHAACPGKPA